MAYDKVIDSAQLDAKLTNIGNAIRGKTGGTDLLTLDGMAEAVNGLSTGGAKVVSGTFVLTEDSKQYTVEHNLGKKPKIVFFGLNTTENQGISDATNPTYRAVLYCEHWIDYTILLVMKTSSLKVDRKKSNSIYLSNINESTVRLGNDGVNTSYQIFSAGIEYQWFVVG